MAVDKDLLHSLLTILIETYGLPAVYEDVRKRTGFCTNCGVPLVDGEPHTPGGMGYCILKVSEK